ncbi:MAG: hypothetical protein IJY14_01150, partial [Acholeplasmatales bacterium]|nr:hypothetical protein [Acholeplasmatales bacterium]
MKIKGMIHSIDIDAKIIGIKQYKRVVYFYFQNSQMNLFKRYLYKGILIELEYDEDKVMEDVLGLDVLDFLSDKDSYTIYTDP